MRKYRYEIIIFVVDAICMILELIASRVLSPYFGNSNIVWTSVIGIILLSSSIGNYIGGKIADKEEREKSLKIVLLSTSIFIFIIPLIQKYILTSITGEITDIKIGAIISTIILFFVPSLLMGIITPIILKLKLDNLDTVGKMSGKITAISTIGGIFGTFLGGFVLIPNIGSVYILFVLTIIIACLVPIVEFKIKDKSLILVAVIIILSIVCMQLYVYQNNINGQKVLDGKIGDSVSYDTQYGRVLIYNNAIGNEPVRVLNIDSGYESATFTNEDKVNELVFEYTKYYDLMFNANINIENALLIGGAGYSYPKYYISHYKDKNLDVVEIDGDITNIAKKYFYLDKLINDYDLKNNHRLNLITDDGRVYLNRNKKKYDAILNDAFSGDSPAKTLTTIEAVQNIKNSLNKDGVYLTNVIGSLDGENSKFLKAEVNTLQKVFKNVYVVPCNAPKDLDLIQNNMVISTDSTIDYKNTFNLNISDNELVITDEYCPVDTLIPAK